MRAVSTGRNIITVIILLFAAGCLFSAGPVVVHGRIVDSENVPLQDVNISVGGEDRGTVSDRRGRFVMTNLSPDDSLHFSHIGFRDTTLMIPGQDMGTVTLTPSVLNYAALVVTGEGNFSHKLDLSAVYRSRLSDGLTSSAAVCRALPGIYFRGYGGMSGLIMLSSDGGQSSDTKVILGGLDITDPQNGRTDMSMVPAAYLQTVTLQNSDLASAGSGAVDASIHIQPWSDQNMAFIMLGEYGLRSTGFSLSFVRPDSVIWDMNGGVSVNRGDFPYTWKGKSFRRINNDFDQRYGSFRRKEHVGTYTDLILTGMAIEAERGVPGLRWAPDDTLGRRHDRWLLSDLSIVNRTPGSQGTYHLSVRDSRESFRNPHILVDSAHHTSSLRIRAYHELQLAQDISLKNQDYLSWEKTESSDLAAASRFSSGASLSLAWQRPVLLLRPGLTLQYSPDLYRKLLPEILARWDIPDLPQLAFISGWSKTFRYPGFNDLYWKPGGNPDLLPEETQALFARILLWPQGRFSMQCEAFSKKSVNLIQWMPQQNYWHPVNVNQASRQGLKISGEIQTGHFRGALNLSRFLSNNRGSGVYSGKSLRFVPDYLVNFNADLQAGGWMSGIDFNWTGPYITMYSYPEDLKINQIVNGDLSLGREWQFHSLIYELNLRVNNVADIDYESINGYPEMGRSWMISMNIKQNKIK